MILIFKEKEANWNRTNEFNCMGKKIRKKLRLITKIMLSLIFQI